MARKVELEVEIDAAGNVRFHVSGAKGKACLEYQALMEAVLGTVQSRELTAEYYEADTAHVHEVGETRRKTR